MQKQIYKYSLNQIVWYETPDYQGKFRVAELFTEYGFNVYVLVVDKFVDFWVVAFEESVNKYNQ